MVSQSHTGPAPNCSPHWHQNFEHTNLITLHSDLKHNSRFDSSLDEIKTLPPDLEGTLLSHSSLCLQPLPPSLRSLSLPGCSQSFMLVLFPPATGLTAAAASTAWMIQLHLMNSIQPTDVMRVFSQGKPSLTMLHHFPS